MTYKLNSLMETAILVELYQKLRTIIEKGIFVEIFSVFQPRIILCAIELVMAGNTPIISQ